MTRLPASPPEACSQAGDEGEAAERLPELTKRLSEVGYLDFVAAFNPLSLRQAAFAAARDSAPPELMTLVDLLLLSRPVSSSRAEKLLGDGFRTLVGLRLLRRSDDDRAVMPNLVLLNVLGCWMF